MSLISACNPVIARLVHPPQHHEPDGVVHGMCALANSTCICNLEAKLERNKDVWLLRGAVAREGNTEDNEKPHHINTETLLRFRAAFYSHSNYSTCIVLASE